MNVEYFMNEAIIEANKAFENNEVPVGGILVDNVSKRIISRNYNKINKDNNSIKHCEINIIYEACETLKEKYLQNTSIFVTLEPCTMCASAISKAQISNVYFGAYDEKNGGIEKIRIAFQRNNIFIPDIYGGIKEEECSKLIKKFFAKMR